MKRFYALFFVAALSVTLYAAVTPNKTDFVDYCTGPNNSNCVVQIDASGNITGNNLTANNNLTSTVNQTATGITVYTPLLVTGVSSTTTISPTATYIRVVSTGNVVTCGLSALPVVAPCISTATATNGQYLVLGGTSAVSSVTFADGTTSGMQLGAATRTVDNLKKLTVIFDSFDSQWKEVSYGNN